MSCVPKRYLYVDKNLETRLKNEVRFTDEMAVHYIRQLLDALIYLRNKRIIHRDLKLANLFVKEGLDIKLGDFGLACKHENPNRKRKSVCGTPNYIAPEILSGDGHSFPVDTWAVGILLFAMLIGKPPFETTNMKSTYNRIQSCMYVFPPDIPIDQNAKSLIMRILTKQPYKRPTYEEILESEYFVGIPSQTPASEFEIPPVAKSPVEMEPQLKSKPESQKALVDRVRVKVTDTSPKSGDKEESPQDTSKRVDRNGQPVLERQKFFKKLFTNEFKGKFLGDPKHATDAFTTPRTGFGKKENIKSREEPNSKLLNRRDPARDKDEAAPKTSSRKDGGNEKDFLARNKPAETKDFEPKILKRLMNHMSNAVLQEPTSDQTKKQEYASAGNMIAKTVRPAWVKLSSDTVTHDQSMFSGGVHRQDKEYSPNNPEGGHPDGSSRKITAFEIIKNSSKINSRSNTIIAEDQIKKDLEQSDQMHVTRYQKEIPVTDREACMEREPSVQSATSHQKKLLFQRMLEHRETKQADQHSQNDEYMMAKVSTNAVGENSGQGRPRFNSAKVGDTEYRLINNFLDGNPVVSPSNADGSSPYHEQGNNGAAKERQERASSAQPANRIKSLWQPQEQKPAPETSLEPSDYVKKWIDHSAKYGLVFIMHSGTIGILFNDMTKALFRIHGEKFVYLSRSQSKKREEVRVYALAFPPKDLEKKTTIMKDILKTLEQHTDELKLAEGDHELVNDYKVSQCYKNRVFIKNWVKGKQVIVFKLSNGIYQAIFQDKSEILISSKHENFIFVDKDRKRYNYEVNSDEIQKNRSVNVRLEYFKKVLKKWIERDSNATILPSRGKLS